MTAHYFETSAFVKLFVIEEGSSTAMDAWDGAYRLVASHLLFVEVRASLAAAHRGKRMTSRSFAESKEDVARLRRHFIEVDADRTVLALAEELAEQEALRGYDAVHLASALHAEVEVLVTADAALAEAAGRHGLVVVDIRG